jgi:hypothetical protein
MIFWQKALSCLYQDQPEQTIFTMSEQNSAIGHNLYSLFASLPKESKENFLTELLQNYGQEIEDFAFYLSCKQAHQNADWVSDDELKAALKQRS